MRESKILDALPDEKFNVLEEMVGQYINCKGPAWIALITDSEIEQMTDAVIKGYKQGRRELLLKAGIPAAILGCATVIVGKWIYKQIKNRKKKKID